MSPASVVAFVLFVSVSFSHPTSVNLLSRESAESCPAGNPNPTYTVEKGDTCLSISIAAGISTLDFEAVNCLDSKCSIQAGATVCLPPQCNPYLVKAGDTCNDIASANGLQPNDFFGYNPGLKSDCSNLEAGANICLSQPSGSNFPRPTCTTSSASSSSSAAQPKGSIAAGTNPACKNLYAVRSGDTCSTIATQHGITVNDFFSLNPSIHNPSCDNVIAGDLYCVASQNSSATGTASAGLSSSTGGASTRYMKKYYSPVKGKRL